MNKLFTHNTLFRENILALIGVCLCFYFAYHTILGNRSLVRLYVAEKQIETLSHKNTQVASEKDYLQKKVTMMRPGSIDKDLLEEQARAVLGYRGDGEFVIVGN